MTCKERRNEKNRKHKLEREKVLELLRQPIEIPQIEKSEYDQSREKNIAQIRKTMKESGLFDD